jgi:hypothetical protein
MVSRKALETYHILKGECEMNSDTKTTICGVLAAIGGLMVTLGYISQDQSSTLIAAAGIIVSLALGFWGYNTNK